MQTDMYDCARQRHLQHLVSQHQHSNCFTTRSILALCSTEESQLHHYCYMCHMHTCSAQQGKAQVRASAL
ncbi:hypothetical protein DUNSADRAFT_16 [Dunaliella salina]|uniref:Encoded protein n=1 Tax=Dunaliella salina TaxID=3046 RepID=A0ABQ7HAL0_DUNSA|nr:hypothetical protein DUNSADRAFT_16 [Dunaliella salina]|eukprot:KAF5843894.1 hypothetical protein DUNSADRAFT_16 [Dunaliella salina]